MRSQALPSNIKSYKAREFKAAVQKGYVSSLMRHHDTEETPHVMSGL